MIRSPVPLAAAGGAALLALATLTLLAGPLDPPSGPVSSTYKTLGEVEPRIAISTTSTPGDADSVYRITQPGSYYLTGNVTGASGKSGIEIAADAVTIDLSGFAVQGVGGSLDGITTDGARGLITIRDGAVGGWGDDGIDLSPTGSGEGSLVEGVIASGNVDRGIQTASLSVVRGCEALNTLGAASIGISVGAGSVVEGCGAHANSAIGIHARSGSALTSCAARGNGTIGIVTDPGCTLTNCASGSNLSAGFVVSADSMLVGCSARSNGSVGYDADPGSTLSSCSSSSNAGNGFQLDFGCTVESCTAYSNEGAGFRLNRGCSAIGSTATSNDADGLFADIGCTVTDCTFRANGGDGLQVVGGVRACHNTSDANGTVVADGAGIRATGSDNRIEGNSCTDNDLGLAVQAAVNLVFGNSCRGNSGGNFEIVAGNRVGLIVVPTVSGDIHGNGPGSGFGTTDPWANFAF